MAELKPTGLTSSLALPEQRLICRVCQKQFSQYTCPRCNVRYCSVACYKGHSIRCTESFMRENVMDAFHQMEPLNETKQRMLEILKRFHSENEASTSEMEDSDEDDFPLSMEMIQKIAKGRDISLDDLSVKDRKHFLQAVASGKLSHLIRPWEPWWFKPGVNKITLSKQGSQLVQPLDASEVHVQAKLSTENAHQDGNGVSGIPPGPENPLSSVQQLTSIEPSPLLVVHLVDVIYSYCFTLRFFNGDWKSDSLDAAMVCLTLSAVLGQAALPESVSEALSNCLETACSPSFKHAGGLQFGIGLFDDVSALLRLGRAALVCALMDLYRLLEAATKEAKVDQSGKRRQLREKVNRNKEAESHDTGRNGSWKLLQSALRKVYFLMCWTNEQPNEVWSSMTILIEAVKREFTTMDFGNSDKNHLNVNNQENPKDKILIEEVM
ncbi:uncharacterized protein LOC131050228 isoform X1 [Cryptomeria japonica]|uniref:uncharacterized protein LOC131050228 isoform X1 n=2 Tax=Cryptomeria japonica TaxID=3369 RepID=UPI0027D9DDF7|nr:uncharacterized protein LOC131050228 isoform X1 [Cryptomeria japonica]XP_057840395.2 uncharacterized protein LOC131050228 isoform X1 [Cryptomeria japonica]XP_057840396.2 uncharacterized protein LOC131050228 isoform X1 [Cryptomeria japonica]XP_059073248.1 uncharacterized protein LOC131050228 isoform X1 [Cryptomeria japonica]